MVVYADVLPSKERKTLGKGCWRLNVPAESNDRARRQSPMPDTRGSLADPSGLPIMRCQEPQSALPERLKQKQFENLKKKSFKK